VVGCGRSAGRTNLRPEFPGNRKKYREKTGKRELSNCFFAKTPAFLGVSARSNAISAKPVVVIQCASSFLLKKKEPEEFRGLFPCVLGEAIKT
jgi:hypothetical protein